MFVSPQNLYIDTLTSGGMIFGGGDFGKYLGHVDGALMMDLVPF